ncbi:MAG: hypothetical protein U0U67_14520 [Chitinophagales bacterium]
MENERGVYFSEYMRDKQVKVFTLIGLKPPVNNWENGAKPYQEFFYETMDFKIPVKYNSIGLRGELPTLKKDSTEFRIVTLGDSFMEGFGAGEDSTFPKLLQAKLDNTVKKVTIINGGKCGSNPMFETTLYKNVLKKWNADLVIMEVNICDIAEFEIASNQGKMPIKEYFLAISHIYRILDNGLLMKNMILQNTSKSNAKKRTVEINKMMQHLNAFQQDLLKNNTHFLVVYLPLLPEINTTRYHYVFSDALKDSLSNSKMPFVDLTPDYKKIIPDNSKKIYEYYYYNDHHHTPKGYNMMAEIVAENLKATSLKENSIKIY